MALCLLCQGLLGYRFSQEQMFMDDVYRPSPPDD